MIRKLTDKKLHKKFHKSLRRKSKQVKDMVPDGVVEKAVSLNPLAEPDTPVINTNVEPITNETIAEHRENVLSGARKYIYPLQHSKHRILVVSASIAAATVIGFLVYCSLGLYKFYQYNTFLYRVTQVVPFPVAKADGRYVDYENYLFELRHYVYYYQNQLGRNFSGDDKQQLVAFRKQALQNTIDNTYIKVLADQNHIGVSNKEVNQRIDEVRTQNRLGSNNKVFSDVLHDYWGWSVNDFRRALKQQILSEKLVAKLDTATTARANAALAQVASGADFATVAKSASDAPDKVNGGDYGFAISDSNPNVPPQVVAKLLKMKPGEVSGIINAGNTLEIVKLNTKTRNSVTASHISFNLQPVSAYIKPLEKSNPPQDYVNF